ncbi:response regulator transcription factor [Shewanella algidipiscicola]|uniref:DNA-binding response regulator n=1 Tax=Shewanella algidipiscicola TaxID=614070 RepID=A0ABQ4PM87_9GAMM|nr:response regulator transcription factor [Shewanella algidipiscicola]GIU49176.1 DNA-binding response regulator [Shewanella algidipiscicola]
MDRVLLIDDDLSVRQIVAQALYSQARQIDHANNGKEALDKVEQLQPELIILDIDISCADGFAFLKSRRDSLPVIVISSNDNEETRIKGYELGADDFIAKPFSTRELQVRVAALQRRIQLARTQPKPQQRCIFKQMSFNEFDYSVEVDERRVILTHTEFNLIKYLFERKGKVVTKQELQRAVLKKELGQFDRNLDMHISNTRRKLAQTNLPKSMINTVRGQGYSFAN